MSSHRHGRASGLLDGTVHDIVNAVRYNKIVFPLKMGPTDSNNNEQIDEVSMNEFIEMGFAQGRRPLCFFLAEGNS